MSKTNLCQRIEQLQQAGVTSAARLSKILKAEGHSAVSESSIKRRIRKSAAGASQPVTPSSMRQSNGGARSAKHDHHKEHRGRSISLVELFKEAEKLSAAVAAEKNSMDAVERAEASLAIQRCLDPALDRYMSEGISKFDALYSVSALRGVDALSTAADVADLITHICEAPFTVVRDEGQSEEDFQKERRAAGEEERDHAIALLEGALQLVRDRGIAKRWLK